MFETHKLNQNGFDQVEEFKENANLFVKKALESIPEGREKSVFLTKLEEAVFFGTKAIASKDENHDEIIYYGMPS